MTPRLLRLAVATLAVAAASLTVAGASSAEAAPCTAAGGVSVVVDFREIGSGPEATCDLEGSGRTATSLFSGNGFPLTYAQRQPGFVCRVSGAPASDPCVNTSPATAYWGLYWSNGTSGSWTYSTLGAGSLEIPAGGSVAFAWQGASEGPPAVAPPALGGSSPSPTKQPTATPTKAPTQSPTKAPTKAPAPPTATPTEAPAPSPTATPTEAPAPSPTATPTEAPATTRSTTPTRRPTEAPTEAPTETVSDPESPSASPTPDATLAVPADPADGAGSVPLPLVLAALALLGGLVSGAAVLRRRRAG